ncbi:hypothetical protein CGLO_17270 [Colletotrichum gloeosporioides Cg-14]|uniref:Uncharacterized protein n=1 Tax=Colletotrichum gloeosporioides (strain Cg-14) TaxID=1237896 RepID=T0KX78_COLGC|nr:hypothetical protein CGLO_17270 [Colletotrichum gloeosporioides Cg-14]
MPTGKYADPSRA